MASAALRRVVVAVAFTCFAVSARAQEQKPEEATLAIPSLTFLAEDLGLWQKHGVKIETREVAGLGSINAAISGSVELAEPSGLSLTRAAARGQKLLAIVETVD